MKFGKKEYLNWYRSILLQRRFEEKAAQLYGQQKIKGFCHLYIGQEAITAGMMSAIKKGDKVITAYRDHGLALAKGISANDYSFCEPSNLVKSDAIFLGSQRRGDAPKAGCLIRAHHDVGQNFNSGREG